MMDIHMNAFYVASEEKVYVCFDKLPELEEYPINYVLFKNGVPIALSDDMERPWEFDNDHHTEYFKPDTRNWLCYKDSDIHKHTRYIYEIKTSDFLHSSISRMVLTE